MSGKDPVFAHTLQQEIDDLRAQALLLPAGRKRNVVLARADALEVTMKAFSWAASPGLQPPRRCQTSRASVGPVNPLLSWISRKAVMDVGGSDGSMTRCDRDLV
jgi:hypothetical protein